MPTKRHRYMVSLPPEHEEAIVARAKAQGRSVANYMETLAVNDVLNSYVDNEVMMLLRDGLTDAAKERIETLKRTFNLPPHLVQRIAEAMMVCDHPGPPKVSGLPSVSIAPRADIHRKQRERTKERA